MKCCTACFAMCQESPGEVQPAFTEEVDAVVDKQTEGEGGTTDEEGQGQGIVIVLRF